MVHVLSNRTADFIHQSTMLELLDAGGRKANNIVSAYKVVLGACHYKLFGE